MTRGQMTPRQQERRLKSILDRLTEMIGEEFGDDEDANFALVVAIDNGPAGLLSSYEDDAAVRHLFRIGINSVSEPHGKRSKR